jgi:UDP-N-acetylmuramoylalanine--D-glutamate ligase
MKLADLAAARILILGLGREGFASYRFLRGEFPAKVLGVADRLSIEQLPPEVRQAIGQDGNVVACLGEDYLASLADYDTIVRSPGIPLLTPALRAAAARGACITSHTEIFLANCPGTVVGVTGTKGKSTTTSLIHAILCAGGLNAHLAGNIGVPPLGMMREAGDRAVFVYELSSYQLDGIGHSPQVAVMLNVVPEHIDSHGTFQDYVAAKRNITRFQSRDDIFVYNAMYPVPCETAAASWARRLGFSVESAQCPGGFVDGDNVVFCAEDGRKETILAVCDVTLPGRFNLQNVLAAVTAAKALGVGAEAIARAVRSFKPLAYRLEKIGSHRGIAFYDDPLATIPEATIAALDALGPEVSTVLLGGYDRGLDMSGLAWRLRASPVRTIILFPPSGARIREALEREYRGQALLPELHDVADMRAAVSVAYANTPPGKICLHSPASPSFGLFKDYAERGNLFRRYVKELGSASAVGGAALG